MANVVLFPFKTNVNFHHEYVWTMELAHRLNLSLAFFTLATEENERADKEAAYHELMRCRGYYVQHYQSQHRRVPKIRNKRIILTTGFFTIESDFTNKLVDLMSIEDFFLVVLQPEFFSLREIAKLTTTAQSTIILPEAKFFTQFDSHQAGQNFSGLFYEILRKSEFFNISNEFFLRLARDKSLFNYLLSFIRHQSLR
ncbi:MAG TPA: hypothetical protein VFW11_21925 [Cyclobacteriaceae bacterium]|nr:hypothetical protein [Cyclobacteriaceae bacterium]